MKLEKGAGCAEVGPIGPPCRQDEGMRVDPKSIGELLQILSRVLA